MTGPTPQKRSPGPWVPLPVVVRDRLHELTGSELKVWVAYVAHADKRNVAWPSSDLLGRETGLHQDTISTARTGLVEKGWLEPAGFIKNSTGHFAGSKCFRVLSPTVTDKTPAPEKNRNRRNTGTDENRSRYRGFTGTVTEKTSVRSRTKEIEPKKKRSRSGSSEPSRLAFSGIHLTISERQDQLLAEAFPWVDRPQEYRKMDSWLEANPGRHPKKHSRFAHNWFSRIELGRNGKRPRGALPPPAGKYSNLKSDALV